MTTPASPPARQLDQFGLPVTKKSVDDRQQADIARALLPRPPSLHWALVLLFTLLSCGIFSWVWYFIQASWVKKIDRGSNATVYLVCALIGMLLTVPLSIVNAVANNGQPSLGTSIAVLLLELGMVVFLYSAFFSMAASLRDEMPKHGVRMDIGGITLFFFTTLYLQGQLSWLAHWKDTGQKAPLPPKGIFWGLFAALWGLILVGLIFVVALIGVSLPGFKKAQDATQSTMQPATIPQDVLPATGPSVADAAAVTGMATPSDAPTQAADAASWAADAAAVNQYPANDSVELARQRAQAEIEQQREALQLERDRLNEQRRQMEEQEQQHAEAARQREIEQQPTADEQYENRRSECSNGFLGSDCRNRIRMEVCEGHWSSNPPPGYQNCRR
ncbi:MAG: hypothetical protein U1F19_05955 [Lysobacterales bacterium]